MSKRALGDDNKTKIVVDNLSEVTVRPINDEYAEIRTKFNSQEKVIIALLFSEEEIKSIKEARSNSE